MGGKFLGPVFQVLIARLLLPADFGVFAIALAWIAAFEIIKDWGLTHAILVRRGGKAELSLQFAFGPYRAVFLSDNSCNDPGCCRSLWPRRPHSRASFGRFNSVH